jgi:hypothetical protein
MRNGPLFQRLNLFTKKYFTYEKKSTNYISSGNSAVNV